MSATAQPTKEELPEADQPRGTVKSLLLIGAVTTALVAIGGATKAWILLPVRMDQQEKAISELKDAEAQSARELRETRELLLEIRGDVRWLKERKGI